MFHYVNPEKLARPTYNALIELLNNCVVNARLSNDHLGDNSAEDAKIERFLDAIFDTNVMQAAVAFVRTELKADFDSVFFRTDIIRMWFELYTNFFNNTVTFIVSGFEHVMFGKGNVKGNGINGYHSWLKFVLDEQSGRADFRGFN